MRNALTLLFFSHLILVSCNQHTVPIAKEETIQFQQTSECYGFTNSDFHTLGVLHNRFLDTIYNLVDFDNCGALCMDDILDAANQLNLDFSVLGLTKSEVIDSAESVVLFLESYDYDHSLFPTQAHGSTIVQSYVEDIIHIIETSSDLSEIQEDLSTLRSVIISDSNVSCEESEIIFGVLSVAYYSAIMWSPVAMGGFDIGSKIYSNTNLVETRAWSWRNAVIGDAIAAQTWITVNGGMWAVGLAVPGSNAAILTAWAVTSAIGSAWGGFR